MNSDRLAVRPESYATTPTGVELDVIQRLLAAADPWGEESVIREVAIRAGLLPVEQDDNPAPDAWRCVCGALNAHPRCVCNRENPALARVA